MSNTIINVAHSQAVTEAEGPGRRHALWVQGCPLRCPGCCNPSFLPFAGGEARTVSAILADMERNRDLQGLVGISLLGGEPLAQAAGIASLAAGVQSLGLSVMIYTGFTLAELREERDVHVDAVLASTDILVDGPYDRTQPESLRRWVGSRNQQVHFLSARHRADEDCWRQRNTLELRVTPSSISVNGFPATEAAALWKGWSRRL